jgi:hypothetical protein
MNPHQLGWQAILNLLAVLLITWMKKTKISYFKWITTESPEYITHIVMLVVSSVTAAGLSFTYTSATGQFGLTGTIAGLEHGVAHILQNYVGVTGIYWIKNIRDSLQAVEKFIQEESENTPSKPL